MSTYAPCLVPTPKAVTRGEGTFVLNTRTAIVLLPAASDAAASNAAAPDADQHAARALQREIRESTGLRLPVLRLARAATRDNIIVLTSDPQAAARFLGERLDWADLAGHGDEAHVVDVTAQRVVAGGFGLKALHLAAQTLRQIARVEGTAWPALRVTDWPSLRYRGLMLDVSRGKVPTLETLKQVVDVLSFYKGNVLQLYTEHTFQFPHHPRIGEGCGSLSGDDILELDAYARQRQVELMPNLQSFGHCAHILNIPEYEHLAESPIRWSLCPTDEGTYALLDDLYAGMLPNFSSATLNVDCDETWDLGKGRTAQEAAVTGAVADAGRLYLNHILRLHELAARYGRRIQLWGDILLHHPELVSELPDDVTLLDWHYEAADDYPSVRQFAASGRDFWVCPGTSSWNTLFPRIENSNANIRTLACLGAEHGASGMLNTDWGDHGHYQPIGQCWYGYAFGLEQAWTGGTTPDEVFDPRFGRLAFGVPGEEVVGAMRDLARLLTLDGMPLRNASRSVYALWDEPLVGESVEALPAETLQEIVRTCQRAEGVLCDAMAAGRDSASLEEMAYSARLMAYAATKVLVCQQVRADLEAMPEDGPAACEVLRGAMRRLRALDGDLVPLVEEFRALWLRRARHAEMGITLSYFDGLRARYRAAVDWIGQHLADIDAGRPPRVDLAAYAEGARGYEILGQAFARRWRELNLR